MEDNIDKLRTELWELRGKLSEQEQSAQHRALEEAHWPHALIKAVDDPFDYAIGLKDGSIIFFEYATPMGKDKEWVFLRLSDIHSGGGLYARSFNRTANIGWDRGLEVRVSEIVWAADAPFGS